MGQIGHGYGSEFQLMRFLGHHRNELDSLIREVIGLNNSLFWFDYPYNSDNISNDGEFKGIEFLKNHKDFITIELEWKKFWPQTGNVQNWDGIIFSDDVYILVEAKAHEKEIRSQFGGKREESKIQIKKAFENAKEYFGIKSQVDWLSSNYYQMCNRIAFLYFLLKNNINAKLLNVYFINGYKINESIISKEKWEEVLLDPYKKLGIKAESLENLSFDIFIECIK